MLMNVLEKALGKHKNCHALVETIEHRPRFVDPLDLNHMPQKITLTLVLNFIRFLWLVPEGRPLITLLYFKKG